MPAPERTARSLASDTALLTSPERSRLPAGGRARAQPFGNQVALRALGGLAIQPRLRVSTPADDLEREADAAAAAVMRAPAQPPAAAVRLSRMDSTSGTGVSRADEGHEEEDEEPDEDEVVQTKREVGGDVELPSDLESQIGPSRGQGASLPPAAREFFEPRFGRDLSNVRVHDDASAAHAARRLDAHALTAGSDIYFASGRYQPHTAEGRSLLAHELAHTIQLHPPGPTPPVVARQAAPEAGAVASPTPSAPSPTSPAAGAPPDTAAAPPGAGAAEAPAEEVELMGAATFVPPATVRDYLAGRGKRGGPVRARFGTLASGVINVGETTEGYQTPRGGKQLQSLPLVHPFFEPLRQRGLVQPVLAIRMARSEIAGYLTAASAKGQPLDYKAILGVMDKHAEALGWLGLDDLRFPSVTNTLEGGNLNFKVPDFTFRIGGFVRGSGELGLSNDVVTFAASAGIKIKKGVAEGTFNVERDKSGLLYGRAELPVNFAKFSGNLIAELGSGTFRIEGLVAYRSEKFDGEVKLIVTDETEARNIARTKLPPEKIVASAEETAGKPAAGKGPRPGPRAVAGWGTLTFRLTEWLAGQATVIIDSEGRITVVGEIAPPAEVELFPQRDYIKPLPKFEARAAYGIPLVGNIFVFANIGFEALAKLGPGKLYKIKIAGTYSTDPGVLQDFSIEGTLNISAFAGLRVRGEGGAGLELLGHDIKAGVGVFALAGVRGYVEATPKIGYREKADPELGKKGESYLRGHMEIAAQPFLGLGGDLFVELDSPWWSPAPDKKWTWPLGELEYPLPGEFGIGADIDYLIGSGKLPEVQFGEVDFSAEKFMTDLMNDHVPPKKVGEEEKKGEWREGEIAGGGEKPPEAIDTQGKPPEGEVATGQQAPGEAGQVPTPEIRERWAGGVKALAELRKEGETRPLTKEVIDRSLETIKSDFGFTELTFSPRGEFWHVYARMNPVDEEDVPSATEAEETALTGVRPEASVETEEGRRVIEGAEVHAWVQSERHHSFFGYLRRAIRDATGTGTTPAGRLRPQRLVEVSTVTHREIHELWDQLTSQGRFAGLARGAGASRRIAGLIRQGTWTPSEIADLLTSFYSVVLRDYPDEQGAIMAEVDRIRELTGI